jgi:hypothetical protein
MADLKAPDSDSAERLAAISDQGQPGPPFRSIDGATHGRGRVDRGWLDRWYAGGS